MGLAGACRSLTSSMFVGAPLPCTASRRHSYYTLRCCCPLMQQKDLFEWRNLFPPATCVCRSTPKVQMRRLCRGLLPLQAEIQAILCNRSRPRCSRSTNSTGARGGPGGSALSLPPGGFAPLSTRESGLTAANESNLQKNTNKLVKSQFAGSQKQISTLSAGRCSVYFFPANSIRYWLSSIMSKSTSALSPSSGQESHRRSLSSSTSAPEGVFTCTVAI